jgi:hypothetical protein
MPNASLRVRNACVCLCVVPTACSVADAVASASLEPDGSQSSELKALPPLPSPTLAAPSGHRLAFLLNASGVKIYVCQAAAGGFAWTFKAPQAALVDRHAHVLAKHYAGPTWESVPDGSKVVAEKIREFTDDPRSIPALLLKANAHEGEGRMSSVSYIQRLETSGGVSPADGCDAQHVSAVARVAYAATYYFYRAARRNGD